MRKNLILVSFLSVMTISCSHGISRVQTRPLPTQNPTNYAFPFPLETVYAAALQAFSVDHQIKHPIFGRSPASGHLEMAFATECVTNAVVAQALFRDPSNAHDIYLHTFHGPFVRSATYRGRDGGLPFIATFHVHLADTGSNTAVTVLASNAEVINGTKFGFGSCGPGQAWNCQGVQPTTVEEYSILRYLGAALGVTNMAPVILPVDPPPIDDRTSHSDLQKRQSYLKQNQPRPPLLSIPV